MKILVYIKVIALSCCIGSQACVADEARDRLDALLIEMGRLSAEDYSVDGCSTHLIRPENKDYSEVVVLERVFRKVSAAGGAKKRVDVRSEFDSGIKRRMWEHFLDDGNVRMYALSHMSQQSLKVNVLAPKEKPQFVPFISTNFLCVPIYEMTGILSQRGYDYLQMFSGFEIVGSRYVDDGFVGVYRSVGSVEVVWCITFKHEPRWMPVKCEAYCSDSMRWDKSKDPFEQLKLWHLGNSTLATWKRNPEGEWLPDRISVKQTPMNDWQERQEAEIVLFNWQLGDEVDGGAYSRDKFSIQEIQNLDFDAIRKDGVESAQETEL
jgi:hypothetical protein